MSGPAWRELVRAHDSWNKITYNLICCWFSWNSLVPNTSYSGKDLILLFYRHCRQFLNNIWWSNLNHSFTIQNMFFTLIVLPITPLGGLFKLFLMISVSHWIVDPIDSWEHWTFTSETIEVKENNSGCHVMISTHCGVAWGGNWHPKYKHCHPGIISV